MFSLPTTEEVNEVRNEIMAAVDPDFKNHAKEFIVNYLRDNGPSAGEVITIAAKNAGIIPNDDRSFGPAYFALSKANTIVKVGAVRRERGHGTTGGNIWALR